MDGTVVQLMRLFVRSRASVDVNYYRVCTDGVHKTTLVGILMSLTSSLEYDVI